MSRMTNDKKSIEALLPKHPYVYAWHKLLGSHEYYIAEQLVSAQRDNAPTSAIYLKDNGDWATMIGLEPATVEMLQSVIPEEYIPNLEEEK